MTLLFQPRVNLSMVMLDSDQLGLLAAGGRYRRLVQATPLAEGVANAFTLEKMVDYSLNTDGNNCRDDEEYVYLLSGKTPNSVCN